jgi:hypothetical protein
VQGRPTVPDQHRPEPLAVGHEFHQYGPAEPLAEGTDPRRRQQPAPAVHTSGQLPDVPF